MSARLLVTACSAGSGNALAPVLARFSRAHVVFAQADAARVFDRWGISYQLVEPTVWDELPRLGERILEGRQVKAVITGTSWGATLDKALTLAAREQGIPCAALVEHWDLYRERFSVLSNGRITEPGKFLPDRIWVNDETARAEAAAAGLPVDRIEAVGQPHLERQFGLLQSQGARVRDDNIMFVSEQVKEDFTPGSPLYRGFDEFQALDALLDSTDFSRWRVLIKLHPQEPADKYDHLLDRSDRLGIIGHADNVELILSAGRIVGMFSMLLLEAALVRSDVISFLPGGNPEVFIGNRLGATLPATTRDELKLLLQRDGAGRSRADSPALPFGSRFLGSTDRMIDAIGKLMA